jgi:hypothetical protein
MKQETLSDRLDRIESEIKLLADKINQTKPADINKKQVAELIDELSLQIKSTKPGISKKDVSAMISDSISEIKPQKLDVAEEIKDAINKSVTRDFVNKLYRGAK